MKDKHQTLRVRDLIKQLSKFDQDMIVLGYDSGYSATSYNITAVCDGEVDGDIWVDTACDGPYTGTEEKVVQIVFSPE